MENEKAILIKNMIHEIRGKKVMLDRDLSQLSRKMINELMTLLSL